MATAEQQALDFNPELQDVSRQRKLAELLMAQGFNQPQGQMISGHYVAPSWTQQLAPLANVVAGQSLAERADTEQAKLAEALRLQKGQALSTFQQLMAKPETRGQAMQFAASNRFLQPLAAKLAEGMKLGEGDRFVMPGMDGQSIEIAAGAPKYRPPLHFDVGNAIELRDPLDPTKVLQRIPKGISPESAARLADEGISGYGGGGAPRTAMPTIGQGSPILAKPGMPTVQGGATMPAAGVNPYEEFNKSIVPPSSLPPKDQRKWMAESNSPLTGEASKQVRGAVNTIEAIDEYRKLLNDYSKLSSLNPEQRSNLTAAYNTMVLQSKEANALGVLNGQDYNILTSLAPNPNNVKNLLVSNETLNKQAEKQRNFMGKVVLNAYGEQQKKIPEYVIGKIKPLAQAPVASGGKNLQFDPALLQYMTPEQQALFSNQGK